MFTGRSSLDEIYIDEKVFEYLGVCYGDVYALGFSDYVAQIEGMWR